MSERKSLRANGLRSREDTVTQKKVEKPSGTQRKSALAPERLYRLLIPIYLNIGVTVSRQRVKTFPANDLRA